MITSIMNATPMAAYKILKKHMLSKGYRFFTRGEFNLNIVGFRTLDRTAGTFNDFLFTTYYYSKHMYFHIWPITTDPGLYYLEHPSRVEGTAILVADQYLGVYAIDKHRGKYDALCQRHGKVRVYRDANRNDILDMDPITIMKGNFGINIHKKQWWSKWIGKSSAGCQVFEHKKHFDLFMLICNKARNIWGNKFTYTLLEQE